MRARRLGSDYIVSSPAILMLILVAMFHELCKFLKGKGTLYILSVYGRSFGLLYFRISL